MLITIQEIANDFICPSDHSPLIKIQTGMYRSPAGKTYDSIGEHPVLVDFDTSILDREQLFRSQGRSIFPRRGTSPAAKMIRTLISPTSGNTIKAVRLFIQKLKHNRQSPASSVRVLIIGGGSKGKGLQSLYDDEQIHVVSFDIYRSVNTQFIADAHSIPLKNGSFDGVIVQAVLEHVLDPAKVVSEIDRVLKPGGMVYSETPFMQMVHEGAYDFTRFTESGHRFLFRKFSEVSSGVIAGIGTQHLWSLEYFFSGLFRNRNIGKIVKLLFFWLQYFDRLVPQNFAVDAASAVYFIGEKSQSSISEKEMVQYYKGAQHPADGYRGNK